MRLSTQWVKLARDFEAFGGRIALAVLAMIFGLTCVIALTSASATLTRDINSAYTSTMPASGILDLGSVDADVLRRIRTLPGVAQAEPTSIVHTRVKMPDGSFGRGILFVTQHPLEQKIGRLKLEEEGTFSSSPAVFLERRALAIAGEQIGGNVTFDLPGIGFTPLSIAGTVFDPSLAPADQEQAVYAYMDQQTWTELVGTPLEMVKIRVTGEVANQSHVDATLVQIANTLRQEQHNVHLIQIPKAQTHPHANQMNAVLGLFLVFGTTAFLLSAFLVSVTVEGLMVQQVRQVGIMKAIGARARQIRSVYLIGVAILGFAALLVSAPIGISLGMALARSVASLLNFDLSGSTPSVWLVAFWVATAILVPIIFALRPLRHATRISVTKALSLHGNQQSENLQSKGSPSIWLGAGTTRLATAGILRNPWRSLMIIGLLAAAGAITLSARNVAAGYSSSVDIAAKERLHDVEIRLTNPITKDLAETISKNLQGAVLLDSALVLEAATTREDGLTLVRTYPDGGHGSLSLMALSDTKSIAHFKLLEGTLSNGFSQGVIINQSAHAFLGRPEVGTMLDLSIDGASLQLPLTAVVRQYMSPATIYLAASDLNGQLSLAGVNNLRFAAPDGHMDIATTSQLESRALIWKTGIANVISENQMVKAVSGHIAILIVTLTAMGLMISAVGLVGLMSAQGISVSERRSEFGILRAIGARRSQLLASLLAEGIALWFLALLAATLVALPISQAISEMIGQMTFGMSLPFVFDLPTLAMWAVGSFVGSLIASTPPALAAIRASVRSSLDRQ